MHVLTRTVTCNRSRDMGTSSAIGAINTALLRSLMLIWAHLLSRVCSDASPGLRVGAKVRVLKMLHVITNVCLSMCFMCGVILRIHVMTCTRQT